MARLELRMFIRATPQRVWDVISDLDGQAHWMVDVRSLDIISEIKSGVGTTLDLQTELYGIPLLHDVMGPLIRQNPGLRLDIVATDRLVDIVEEGFDAGIRFGERLVQDMIAVKINPTLRFAVVGAPEYFNLHALSSESPASGASSFSRPFTSCTTASGSNIRRR